MAELLDPRNDFVFKRIFGSEENKDVLLAFLNRIFEESRDGSLLTKIVLLNPYTDKEAPEDKQSIMDIWAMADSGELINIEMQLLNNYDIEKRTLYFHIGMFKFFTAKIKRKKIIPIGDKNFLLNAVEHHRITPIEVFLIGPSATPVS